MEQQHIDELLERYLGLLDEYTVLRQNLSQLQSGVYQSIARANFSGERGMRYGQDHYDERMQASRRLIIDVNEKLRSVFTVIEAPVEEQEEEAAETGKESAEKTESQSGKEDAENTAQKKIKPKNPLHWFGLFAPTPLRTAQTQSVQAVVEVIPRLVSINAEMLNLEIEVRRARKRRAKAEAAAEKKDETATNTTNTQSQTAPVEAS